MGNRRTLTNRECQVAIELSQGKTNREIALALGRSEATVKRHLSTVMIKWDCSNRTQVALEARRRITADDELGVSSEGV